MANAGDRLLFSETTFIASNENTNTKASDIPIAKFAPKPPRLFCEDKDSAKKVSRIIDTGIEVR